MVNVGIKVLILVQGRSLISSGRITMGDLLAFFLYQKPLSTSIHVRITLRPTNDHSLMASRHETVVHLGTKTLNPNSHGSGSKRLWLFIQEFLYATGEMESMAGVIAKVLGYLDRTPDAKPAGQLVPEQLEGGICFQNVTFAYPSTPDKPVLKVSLCLGTGLFHVQMVVIIIQ